MRKEFKYPSIMRISYSYNSLAFISWMFQWSFLLWNTGSGSRQIFHPNWEPKALWWGCCSVSMSPILHRVPVLRSDVPKVPGKPKFLAFRRSTILRSLGDSHFFSFSPSWAQLVNTIHISLMLRSLLQAKQIYKISLGWKNQTYS